MPGAATDAQRKLRGTNPKAVSPMSPAPGARVVVTPIYLLGSYGHPAAGAGA